MTLINEIAGLVENNIKTTFNSATMGFPFNDVQLGFQYSPGDTVRLWRGVKYNISTSHTSYIKNGINYNFRNWNNYESYTSPATLRVLSNTTEFRSNYYPTIPLTIANNLEGGSSNNDFELTWQNPEPDILFPWQFGAQFNAFDFQEFGDHYSATAPNSFQALSTTWWFQNWEDGSDYNVKSNIQVTSPVTYSANYKGHLRSNSQTALNDGPQRRLVRTDNGIYHLVYESMGLTWYTYSLTTNFNGAWSDEECLWGKNPSIDFEDNIVKIVEEFQYEPGVILFTYEPDANGQYYNSDYETVTTYDASFYGNAKPVISYNYQKVFVAYRKNFTDGIYQRTKYFYQNNWYWKNEGTIPNTTRYSSNPSTSGFYDYLFLVYQEANTIKYYYGYWFGNPANQWDYRYYSTISTGAGFRNNYYPSISCVHNGNPIVSWVADYGDIAGGGGGTGKNEAENGTESIEPRVVVRAGDIDGSHWGDFFKVGDHVASADNNSLLNAPNDASIIAWTEGSNPNYSSKWVRRQSTGYTSEHSLSNNGKQIQISNGTSLTDIGGVLLSTSTTPYDLTRTTTDFSQQFHGGGITKIKDYVELAYGREGVIAKNGIEFLFDIGDVIVGDSVIKFIVCPDTVAYSSAAELNDLVRTEAFNLNSTSEFYFTDFYYVLNKEEADSLLTEDDVVSFKAELINEQTGAVVGTFDNITYTKEQLERYDNASYQVDCGNITSGNYYLRLVTSVQGDAGYFLGNVQNNEEELEKHNYNQINFDGTALPTVYVLSQNFPNPFNPATTINYQLPQTGFITLKVFDILGREVATLVNEQKIQGRYSVNFNASRLASGVYIYQVRVNDFVSSKKMMLVK